MPQILIPTTKATPILQQMLYANYRELSAIYGNNYTCGDIAEYADIISEAMQNAENSLRWIENMAFVLFDSYHDYIYIHNLYTMPEHRDKGHAQKLVKTVLDIAKQKQVKYVPVLVHKNNSKAISLFGKLGFTNLGSYKYGLDDNVMEFRREI